MARLRDDGLGDVDLAVEDVAGNFEIGRPRRAGVAFARGHGDHVGDALGRAHAGRELGDGPHDVDMRQILQRAHHVLRERALAADVQDRAFRAEGGGDPGHRIHAAGPRRRHDAAELAGLARIAVGGVRRHLLVPHVDDADAFIDAAVIYVNYVAAAQREDRVDALVLERLGDEVAARDDIRVPAFLPQRVVRRRRYAHFRHRFLHGIG